ncbi:energy transducer TonB [Paracrocinitomix mangrovi]|uniref:energy transducer TonB family protein n=1 Tax=Paracrocinitomix mangrovi TaxID=2862509 RepID=UPI001C8DAC3A|nr:energy transducer TonB [Paracrocinitomix mangrovi]UKN02161.1 energy transducer TonB [Paracrocinitomix mangrovi]
MDQFLDYIEKYKFAIFGTIGIHILFFFYANFTTLKQPYKIYQETTEIYIPLEDIEMDPEIMKILEVEKKEGIAEEVTNISADQNDKRDKSFENFSSQELDEQVENEAKALEQQYFDEWASTHDNSGDNSSSASDKDSQLDKKNNSNNINNRNMDSDGANAVAGEVMVSYSLDNRKAHSLPRPGYTCNSSGTVVIDVKVDQAGNVKSASVNTSRSNGATECMIDKALTYAKKSRFNFSNKAPGSQSGTITYKFVSK